MAGPPGFYNKFRIQTSNGRDNHADASTETDRFNRDQPRTSNARSAKACLFCRHRKVRCDALARKPQPCTNCTLDRLQCKLTPRTKSSGRRNTSLATVRHGAMSIQPGPESPTLPKSHLTQSRGPFWNENDSAQDLASSGSLSTSTDQTWLQPQLPPQRDQDTGQNDLSLMQDPKPLDRTTIEDWDVGLLPTAEWNQNALFFSASAGASASASNLTSQTSMGSLPHDHDLGFADLDLEFTDAAILEPYLHHVDVLDPSTTEFLSIDHNPTLSAAHDGAYTFKSPLPWVADWSIEDHRNDSRYAEVVEQRVFNLPELSKIDILLQLYFSRAHHRLPVLNERYFFLLTQGQGHHGQAQDVSLPPISLALMYAIMFSACPFLRTEGMDPARIRTIRSMRCEYYSRAALLFKLGCESDSLRKVQICLILSTFRNYPGNFYENERWTIKAYRLLETAGVLPNTNTNRSQGFVENPDWRRVSACWLHRFTSSFMGLKWTSSPELMEAVMFPWHQITLADFEEDFGFSWYLSAETKEQLTRIFVARISLQVTIGHLNKILWKQTVSEMSAIGGKPEIAAPQLTLTDSLPIEEIDVRLQRWKLENEDSLPMAASVYGACPEKRLLYAEHILTSMAYEYAMVNLYQNTLIVDRRPMTKWSAGMTELSRSAVWDSITSLVAIFKEVLDGKLVALIPPAMLIVVLVPLTLYSLHLQKVLVYDPSAIQNLSICSQLADKLTDAHDGASFYISLLNNTLILADRYNRASNPGPGQPQRTRAPTKPAGSSDRYRTEAETVLPDPQLHSLVLRFQVLALALGRLPATAAVL